MTALDAIETLKAADPTFAYTIFAEVSQSPADGWKLHERYNIWAVKVNPLVQFNGKGETLPAAVEKALAAIKP